MTEPLSSIQIEILSAFIGAGATIVAASIGFFAIIWQIGRQAKMARDQIRENDSQKVKLHVYELATRLIEDASNAEVQLSSYVSNFRMQLEGIKYAKIHGVAGRIPDVRIPKFLELSSHQNETTILLVKHIERWTIIDPRIKIFQYAFNSVLYDIREAWSKYFQIAMTCAPMARNEEPDKDLLLPWHFPDKENLERLYAETDLYIETLNELGSYIFDFQVELQNLLLKDLFSNKVEIRKPIDPRFKVIQLNKFSELKTYFLNDTAWGKNVKVTEDNLKAALSLPAQ